MLCCSATNEMETEMEMEMEQGSEDWRASQVSAAPGGLYECRRAGIHKQEWLTGCWTQMFRVTRDTKYDRVAVHMHTSYVHRPGPHKVGVKPCSKRSESDDAKGQNLQCRLLP